MSLVVQRELTDTLSLYPLCSPQVKTLAKIILQTVAMVSVQNWLSQMSLVTVAYIYTVYVNWMELWALFMISVHMQKAKQSLLIKCWMEQFHITDICAIVIQMCKTFPQKIKND